MMIKSFMAVLVLFSVLQAEEYKAVYDCSSSDASYIKNRMWLIGKTFDMIEQKGDKANFVMTVHGGCVPLISTVYDEIVDEADEVVMKKAQESLGRLVKEKKLKVIVCAMSLAANTVERKEVLPFVTISENSFVETIYYQNHGYALMTFK